MTSTTNLTDEMKAKIAALKAGRQPPPTTKPITTLTPPKGK